ncbi:MAG: FAD-dependent oxidoreductase [Microscillaceae bacterium]|jgi:thioredoxin reductase (NADPH)|nr:FAD-dependent oxidoreductase [Microscillaceae bacterium]
MKPPIIITVDDDPQVLRAIQRDLNARYRKDYKIIAAESGESALEVVKSLKQRNEVVALIVSDQRMPGMQGVDLLLASKDYYPEAKKVLLTAYADTGVAIKAINDVQLDYYLLKPWDPPEQNLYPPIDELLSDWNNHFLPDLSRIKIIGFQWAPLSHELRDFLAANLIPYSFLDIETSKEAEELLQLHQISKDNLPAVIFEDGKHLARPNLTEVAEKAGLNIQASQKMYDLVIIGAGPSGLAASVYGASEGLNTLLIERRAPGGQAGASSRIENYLGFPTGLSGAELTKRAITQTLRFGTELLSPREVVKIELKDGYKIITLNDDSEIKTKTVLVATGVSYRELEVEGIQRFTGAGVYYGSVITEAHACRNTQVFVVGGGNSAGQAAMFLSRFAGKVNILIRGEGLAATMSSYLIDQIKSTPNIEVHNFTVVKRVCGSEKLEEVEIVNVQTHQTQLLPAKALFVFIGTKPFTEWLPSELIKDDKGFLLTGRDLIHVEGFAKVWKMRREPYLLETSIPGIFASGDVRVGGMGRVASAVGEGSMAVKFVHQYLSE